MCISATIRGAIRADPLQASAPNSTTSQSVRRSQTQWSSMLRREESRSDRDHQDEMHQRGSKDDASCGRDQLRAQYSTSGGIVAFSATSARTTSPAAAMSPGANTRG